MALKARPTELNKSTQDLAQVKKKLLKGHGSFW